MDDRTPPLASLTHATASESGQMASEWPLLAPLAHTAALKTGQRAPDNRVPRPSCCMNVVSSSDVYSHVPTWSSRERTALSPLWLCLRPRFAYAGWTTGRPPFAPLVHTAVDVCAHVFRRGCRPHPDRIRMDRPLSRLSHTCPCLRTPLHIRPCL